MITRQSLRPLANVAKKQWICASCSSSIVATQPIPSLQPQQRRTKYTIARLNHHDAFYRDGVAGIFSREAYVLGYLECQDTLVNKLNQLTTGTSAENLDVKALAIRTGRNPAQAAIFNNASLAHNNHFFFQQFSPSPKPLSQFPDLEESFIKSFGSVETLRREFTDMASSVFGQGFVWLLWAREPDMAGARKRGTWRIMNTYNAGTPYPEAGFMQQGLDMNTSNQETFDSYKSSYTTWLNNAREQARLPPGSTTVMPVLCLSMWQHSYLRDFGPGGKEKYADAFWDAIDWQIVMNRTPAEVTERLRSR